MKINYNNTALGLIDDPKNFAFGFPDPDITPKLSKGELLNFGHSLITGAETLKELCGSKIEYISKPFFETFVKARHKLADVILHEEIEDSGTLLMGGYTGGYTHFHTYYYYVKTFFNDKGEWDWEVLFMDFSKHSKADSPALDVFVSRQGDSLKTLIWNGYTDIGRDISFYEAFIISFVFFKRYCEIETKVLPPKSKGNHINVKYVNQTDKRITILDSTWFTTIVKSEGFAVRGHFRFQPYGPGLKLRKLIWIDTFEKEGYTRTAKVLNQSNNET